MLKRRQSYSEFEDLIEKKVKNVLNGKKPDNPLF